MSIKTHDYEKQAGEYAEAILPRDKRESIRSPKPEALPVLA